MKLLKKIIFLILFTGIPLFAQWELIWENTTYGLYGVSAPDTMHIWAVGDSGKILHSNDGGDNWFWQESGITTDLFDVVFIDSSRGWAVGDSGAIINTIDGGQTWNIQYIDTTVALSKMYMFKNDSISWILGYKSGSGGKLYKSTDYGQNWYNYYDSSFSYISEEDYHFISGSMGCVISEAPISFTKNAGISWVAIDYRNYFSGGIISVCFTDTLNGFLGLVNTDQGMHFYFIKTNDGGITWNQINDKRIRRINFYNKNIGWAYDFGYDIMLTTNGGNTWHDTWQQGVSYILDLDFANKNIAFTSGSYPIYIGQNRGEIHRYRIVTDINNEPEPKIPVSMELSNYPNPFNSNTHITLNINHPQSISINIYNTTGQLIKTIIQNKHLSMGKHEISWNGTDNNNKVISTGIYFITFKSDNNIQLTKKCLFLK